MSDQIKKILRWTFHLLCAVLAAFSMLSIFRNGELRYLKILDFPRIQFFILTLAFLAILQIYKCHNKKWHFGLSLALIFGLLINSYFLKNYTFLVNEEVSTQLSPVDNQSEFSLLISNVKMSNHNSETLLKLIKDKNPDILLAMETDHWWEEQLKKVSYKYPYSHKAVNELTYGMILYSKFPLENIKVDYLSNENVPSIESSITLKNGKSFRFHCVHPVPPTHFEDLPDNANERETAFQKVGKLYKRKPEPSLIAGDFNDVVWDRVDNLTDTKNVFYDVRVGRGFFSSFNAEHFYVRWPLDHILVTNEFKLKKLERLENIGSDHFPIYAELIY